MNKKITREHLELEAREPKEEGYDEWLRERLERTIKKLDSGEMKSYPLHEAMERLEKRRAEWRSQRLQ